MKKLYQWFCKAEEAAVGVGFMFLILFVFLSAVIRLFKISWSWSIDLAMLLLAWTAFLGADAAWRGGQIMGVDLLTRKLPKTVQRIIELIVLFIILTALVIIVIFGSMLAWTDRLATFQSMPIPYALVTFSLVIASFSMIFSTVQKITRVVQAMRGKGQAPIQSGGSTVGNVDETGATGGV